MLCRTFFTLLFFRFLLFILPYRRIGKFIRVRSERNLHEGTPHLFAWAVNHASRLVPGASCLTQALALQYLLAREGMQAVMRIGVKCGPDNQYEAHAWVLLEEEILIGGSPDSLSTYSVLTDLTPEK
ncbi:MAG: lasso peptide biosynthesis B2 protein [Erythrobacter sp.]